MTTPADVRTDEEAFAACLSGRPVPAGAQGLAAFTDAVRSSATAPGRPNAALAELLATGLLVPTQEPSRGTAGRPARTSRKRPHVLISTLAAKFAAAGAVAKAACATPLSPPRRPHPRPRRDLDDHPGADRRGADLGPPGPDLGDRAHRVHH